MPATLSLTGLIDPLAIGLGLWLFTWGVNRVYLNFKSFLS